MPGQDDAEYFVEIMQVVETCKVSIEKEKKSFNWKKKKLKKKKNKPWLRTQGRS